MIDWEKDNGELAKKYVGKRHELSEYVEQTQEQGIEVFV